jgi:transposase
MIVIGIDPHKSSHTASALDVGTHQLTDRLRIEASLTEYRRLLAWAKRVDERQWAVENAEGLGHHLAQWLLARGETVVDVPATATARVRELSRGRRKTDTLDAAAAASVAALHGMPARCPPRAARRCWACSTSTAPTSPANAPAPSTSCTP